MANKGSRTQHEDSKKLNILEEANSLTGGGGDRTKAYGSALDEAQKMVDIINTLFGTKLEPSDWYLILIIMKLRRYKNKARRDALTDIAGYARVIEILHSELGDLDDCIGR